MKVPKVLAEMGAFDVLGSGANDDTAISEPVALAPVVPWFNGKVKKKMEPVRPVHSGRDEFVWGLAVEVTSMADGINKNGEVCNRMWFGDKGCRRVL